MAFERVRGKSRMAVHLRVAARRVVRGWRFVPVSLAGSAGYADICAFLHWSCVGWLEMMAHLEVPVSWVIRGWLVVLVSPAGCDGYVGASGFLRGMLFGVSWMAAYLRVSDSGRNRWLRDAGVVGVGRLRGRKKLGRTSVCPPYCARIFAISRVRRINLRLSVKES